MSPLKTHLSVCVLVSFTTVSILWASTSQTIAPGDARKHIGDTMTVCGTVTSSQYASTINGNRTYLNLDKPYPSLIFRVVILDSDRAKFGRPEQTFRWKPICVTGEIQEYQGVPQIVAHTPTQIKIESDQKSRPKTRKN